MIQPAPGNSDTLGGTGGQDLKDRIIQTIRAGPQTSEELAAQEVPANSANVDIEKTDSATLCDKHVTGKKGDRVTVTYTMYVDYFRANQDRRITILDLVQHFHVKPEAVRQAMSRIFKTGPVHRIVPGLYQYDPTKEHGNLHSVLRSGNWKFENVVLVTRPTPLDQMSRSDPTSAQEKNSECDMQDPPIPAPGPGAVPNPDFHPWILPTGQTVSWWIYPTTGTGTICISAKGAPPLDPGYLLYILDDLKTHGMDPAKWDVICVEYLIDSEKIRYDGYTQYQLFEKVVYKGYNHGYYGRFEKADRRITPASEFVETCRILASGSLNAQALREVNSLKKDVEKIGKIARTALNVTIKERDKRISSASRKASDLLKERVPVTDHQEGKTP